MMVDQRILAAIDCCRPGSDDLANPELAEAALEAQRQPQLVELRQRIERFDLQVRSAMKDVEIPDDLAERLMAGVAQATTGEDPESNSDSVDELATQEISTVAPQGRSSKNSRRLAITATLALAASTLIAVTMLWLQQDPPQISFDSLEREVSDWGEVAWNDSKWNSNMASAPESRPMPTQVLAVPRRWQSLKTSLDRETVVYDLTPPGSRHRSMVYVARSTTKVTGVTLFPPVAPQSTTGGRSLAAWRDDSGLLYVLVVEGPRRRYRDLVDTDTGPLI